MVIQNYFFLALLVQLAFASVVPEDKGVVPAQRLHELTKTLITQLVEQVLSDDSLANVTFQVILSDEGCFANLLGELKFYSSCKDKIAISSYSPFTSTLPGYKKKLAEIREAIKTVRLEVTNLQIGID